MESRRCSNCNRDVYLSNFTIHEAFCIRNLKKCELCDNIVSKKFWNDHISSEHSEVQCGLCKTDIEKFRLTDHEVSCPARLVKCRYCSYELPLHSAEDHVSRCGSRTELCTVCHKYVLVRDSQEHSSVHTRTSTGGHQLSADDGDDFKLALQLQCMELKRQLPTCGTEYLYLDDPEGFDSGTSNSDVLIPCEYCCGSYKVTQILEHQINCRKALPLTTSPASLKLPSHDVTSAQNEQSSHSSNSSKSPKKANEIFTVARTAQLPRPKNTNQMSSTNQQPMATESGAHRPAPRNSGSYTLPPLRDPLISSRAAASRRLSVCHHSTGRRGTGTAQAWKSCGGCELPRRLPTHKSTSSFPRGASHQKTRRPVEEQNNNI